MQITKLYFVTPKTLQMFTYVASGDGEIPDSTLSIFPKFLNKEHV